MKLSEAIRLGSMMKPQAFGATYAGSSFQAATATCAMGAAIDAIGCPITIAEPGQYVSTGRSGGGAKAGEKIVESPEEWCPFLRARHTCPRCDARYETFGMSMIAHLNDYHQLTRKAIADWVEQIENQQAAIEQPRLAGVQED